MGKLMHLTYASSLSRLCEINSSFDSGVLRVAYTNSNKNGSYISKETYERCMQTIFNCPIVCNYDRDTDTIGSHDVELVTTKDGGMRMVNITTPVGTVPESAQPYWEIVEEDDGTIHEYLCVDVLLWKRQEAYKKIKNDGISSESMEINVKDGVLDKESGLFIIRDFEFTAFCLLGDGVTPCFESASLEVFSSTEFKQQMEQMMSDLKETFTAINSPNNEIDMRLQKFSTEGGDVLDEKMALVAEYGLSADELTFSIDDFSVEELREKFEAMKDAEPANDGDAQENFELAGQVREEIVGALEGMEQMETCFGEMPRYWYVDHNAEAMEVYCYDGMDWKLYGFSYSMNGDNVVVNADSKKRMKYDIVEFDEGDQGSPFAAVFSVASDKFNENDTVWSEKYQAASDEIASMKDAMTELDALRQFKAEADEATAQAERERVFAQFEDLVGVEAFEALVDNCKDFDVATLEEKCFAIRGRNGTKAKFAQEPRAPKIVVDKTEPEDEPYGGFIRDYKNK